MEKKLKHLEFIQNVISRMANNLFLLKGWVVTLVAALLALLASNNAGTQFIFIALVPIIIFWLLDGYFLSQERMYRDLYKDVAKKQEDQIDFSMDASKYNTGRNRWLNCFFSKTLVIFYGLLLLLFLIIIYYNFDIKISISIG
ncbi:MAG: hypothetical protein WC465_04595 [Patescibacteria group bacterium]